MGSNSSTLTYRVVELFSYNGKRHHTARYAMMRPENGQLVVRRGQTFALMLILNQKYAPKRYIMDIQFIMDDIEVASVKQGNIIPGNTGKRKEFWGLSTKTKKGRKKITAKVFSPVNAAIGQWTMKIRAQKINSHFTINICINFCMLFNAWCLDDMVYLRNENERQEYVMEETGIMWRGAVDYISGGIWHYAQFENSILDCAYYLISEVAKIPVSLRHDPVIISRALSAYINNNTGKGIIIGNWTDDFSGGISPLMWLGSRQIIQYYYKHKKPVKYGQCWVYAGVYVTISRALGLPCRNVTAFESAHDTDLSLTVDLYEPDSDYDDEDTNNNCAAMDFIWSYHVWNEVWMKRTDLDKYYKNYVGWNVIDSTPPLKGKRGIHRCGPAPLSAVKYGAVNIPYDCAYIFAEVNADLVLWKCTSADDEPIYIRTDTKYIGKSISTKAVGAPKRVDITNMYKFPEGSKEAKTVMAIAKQLHLFKVDAPQPALRCSEFEPIKFDFQMPHNVVIGAPFSVVLQMTNNDTVEHVVDINLHIETTLYTRHATGGTVKSTKTAELVQPGAVEVTILNVSWDDYREKLLSQYTFDISCRASVRIVNYEFMIQRAFHLNKPDIIIKINNGATVGMELQANASLTNPLPLPLRNGVFFIDGTGLDEQLNIKLTDNIKSNEKVTVTFSMIPKYEGKMTIAAKFYSSELDDVDGFVDFTVKPKKIENSSCSIS